VLCIGCGSCAARSRRYPTEPSEVLRTIRATPGRYVVGLPCFIKAGQQLRREGPVLRAPAEVAQVGYRECGRGFEGWDKLRAIAWPGKYSSGKGKD
jgi:hypothetical protein